MSTSNALKGLKDIIVPSTLETGSLAPGWWIVISAIVIILAIIGYVLWRYWYAGRHKRMALAQINKLKSQPIQLDQLNQLLKRTALVYYPRETVASLSGKTWFEFLNAQTGKNYFDDMLINDFIHDLYRGPRPASEQQITAVCQWLKHARIHRWRHYG